MSSGTDEEQPKGARLIGQADPAERILAALTSPTVPQIYANGFTNNLSNGDILTVFERNGSPTAAINMSFTLAKTLSVALGQMIAQIEQATGREMLTTFDLEAAMEKKTAQTKESK